MSATPRDFIREAIDADLAAGRAATVHTRFPPEPNGYLHIGHAKAVLVNYGLAQSYDGAFNLRFDDTNPVKEDEEFVRAITEDVAWLGAHWDGAVRYASDYFETFYELAEKLIRDGHAYVDSLPADEIRRLRGTDGRGADGGTPPGQDSPFRTRTVEENLDLFRRMRAGEFPDGAHVLRGKIDMAHPNLNMRDPVLYRINRVRHHRTGDAWCIYPMYDYAHPLEDALEGITFSCCSLEFENHRPLYDWVIEKTGVFRSRQIEFARLQLGYTVLSKRWLRQLVEEGRVDGWDDPRMPTLQGMRRRGYTPGAIRDFCERVGLAKTQSRADPALLEHCLREELNRTALRRMAVLRPLKVVIENYPEGQTETVDVINNPEDPAAGTRSVEFGRELFIERDDFMENPPAKFFRLSPGREARLRCAYFITCREAVKDASGEVVELRCTYDPATRGGDSPDGRKVKATLHWVSAGSSVPAEVRLYRPMFTVENPHEVAEGGSFLDHWDPASREVVSEARLEPVLMEAKPGAPVQFERLGYFHRDATDTPEGRPVFHRAVTLKDAWAKASKK